VVTRWIGGRAPRDGSDLYWRARQELSARLPQISEYRSKELVEL